MIVKLKSLVELYGMNSTGKKKKSKSCCLIKLYEGNDCY